MATELRSSMEVGEVLEDAGWPGDLDEKAEEALEAERKELARGVLESGELLKQLDRDTEALHDCHSDLARAFRNLKDAFAGRQYAVDAVLQAVLNMRQVCMDKALRMVQEEV